MFRHLVLRWLIFLWISALLLGSPVGSQPPHPEGRLTVEEVVQLTRAGFGEDIIITKIKKNGKPFDLSADELLDLKKEGVSDNVIKYLLDPSQPYTPPPPPAPAPASGSAASAKPANAAKKYPADRYANRVPAEPGLYWFPTDAAAKIDLKFLLGTEGKGLLKKSKTTAYLIEPASKTRSKSPVPVFYMRLPEGREMEEFVLLAFSEKNGHRELEVGPSASKQQLKAEQMRPYESLEVGPHLFRLTPGKLDKGEYLFFLIGSADPAKGVYGKGYDFGIDAVQQKAK